MLTRYCLKVLCLAAAFLVFSHSNLALAQKRVYLALDDHTDYEWSADASTYRQVFRDTINYYMNLFQQDQTNGVDPRVQQRFNLDGSFWAWEYLNDPSVTAAQRTEFISRIKDGHFSIPLTPLVLCQGGMPAEALIRSMYFGGQLERQYNFRIPLAVAMENQTFPYGVGSIWAGAGAKYSWRGICGCASRVAAQHSGPDMFWLGGPDGSRILMKWYRYVNNQGVGGYAEARSNLSGSISTITAFPYNVLGLFGKGWDDLSTMISTWPATVQSITNSNVTGYVSNETDFFTDFEATHGATLGSYAASSGNEWDLYSASMSELSASVKRYLERLRAAEALSSLVVLKTPGFMSGREPARDLAMINFGIYFEHNWTADGPISKNARRDWERSIATSIQNYVEPLYSSALSALGAMIQKSGTAQRFFVFNPLGWERSDFADFPYSSATSVKVIDLVTQLEVPSQIVTNSGTRYIRIFASQIPAVGYKVFELQNGTPSSQAPAATVNGSTFENSFYKVVINGSGAITSLIDKQRGNREFVLSAGVLNDLGTGSTAGTITAENSGPVSVTLKASSTAVLSHDSRITLFRDINRIDIANQINQNFSSTQSWRFAYNLANPDVRHEEVGAVIRAKLLASGGHYSPNSARYDWMTINHFADMSGDGNVGITLSNSDLYFMKVGNSSTTSLDSTTPELKILAGGQVDGATYGIASQGGDTSFLQRFALATHDAFSQRSAMKFSLEHQNPFVTGNVSGGAQFPAQQFSLLSVSNPDVLLWALKPADDGPTQGLVARLWNQSDSAANFSLSLPQGSISSARNITHVETPIVGGSIIPSGGSLSLSMARQQIKSFEFVPSISGSADTLSPGNPQNLHVQ